MKLKLTYSSFDDFNSNLGLGFLVCDIRALGSSSKGEPVEKGSLGGAENNCLCLLGVPFTTVLDSAVSVGPLRQEPLRCSLKLDANLDLKKATSC